MVEDIETAPWEIDYDRRINKTCTSNNFVHTAKKYPLDRDSALKSEYDRLSTFQQCVWKTMWKVWKTSEDMKFALKNKISNKLSTLHKECQKRILHADIFRCTDKNSGSLRYIF